MNFCPNCGRQIEGDLRNFCPGCGKALQAQQPAAAPAIPRAQGYQQPQVIIIQQPNLLQTLSVRLKTEATIWTVIGVLQILIGVVNAAIGNFALAVVAIVGIINLVNTTKQRKYSQAVLTNPVGIVARFRPVGGYIFNLIWNLIFGGVIGVVGNIYTFTIRNFVLSNEQGFNQLEAGFQTNAQVPVMAG